MQGHPMPAAEGSVPWGKCQAVPCAAAVGYNQAPAESVHSSLQLFQCSCGVPGFPLQAWLRR